jgi:hypothetical protein
MDNTCTFCSAAFGFEFLYLVVLEIVNYKFIIASLQKLIYLPKAADYQKPL